MNYEIIVLLFIVLAASLNAFIHHCFLYTTCKRLKIFIAKTVGIDHICAMLLSKRKLCPYIMQRVP